MRANVGFTPAANRKLPGKLSRRFALYKFIAKGMNRSKCFYLGVK